MGGIWGALGGVWGGLGFWGTPMGGLGCKGGCGERYMGGGVGVPPWGFRGVGGGPGGGKMGVLWEGGSLLG